MKKEKDRPTLVLEALESNSPEDLKAAVCPFFKGGNYSECRGCPQAETKVQDCAKEYLEHIEQRPMEVFAEGFFKGVVIHREKVSLDKLKDIGLVCDSCYMSDKCPIHQVHAACGIDWGTLPDTPKDRIEELIKIQYARINRLKTFEQVDGGVADANLSQEMDRMTGLVQAKLDIEADKFSFKMDVQSRGNSGGAGILASLFGKPAPVENQLPEAAVTTIPVQAQDVEFTEELVVGEKTRSEKRKEKVKKEKNAKKL